LDVGRRFLEDGFIVKAHPYQESKSDDYDLMVKPSDRANWREIEVKGNGKCFTCVEDFPYKSVFVETVNRRESRKSLPVYYAIVSYKTGEALCVPGTSHQYWSSMRTRDTQKNLYDDFLTCPKEYCETWDQMISKLQGVVR
jgi:hypothetical protein